MIAVRYVVVYHVILQLVADRLKQAVLERLVKEAADFGVFGEFGVESDERFVGLSNLPGFGSCFLFSLRVSFLQQLEYILGGRTAATFFGNLGPMKSKAFLSRRLGM
jgi:hypothetical protein